MPDDPVYDPPKGRAIVLAYLLVALSGGLSGFLLGLGTGWLLWG